jgi:hypothetical protein
MDRNELRTCGSSPKVMWAGSRPALSRALARNLNLSFEQKSSILLFHKKMSWARQFSAGILLKKILNLKRR